MHTVQVISDLEKEIDDDPEHAYCSCERLQQRKSVTRVKLSDHLGSKFWPDLKAFILEHNPDANEQVLYMCNYCKPLIKHCHRVVSSMICKQFQCPLNWRNWIV